MYDSKSAVTGNAVEHAGKDTYFRDVHLFIERIKDIAVVKDTSLVRQTLYTCLRGVALEWYTAVLTEDQKRLIKLGDSVDKWARILLKRWKELPSTAMSVITKERYSMDDARREREPFGYASILIRDAKSTDMTTELSTCFCTATNGLSPDTWASRIQKTTAISWMIRS